MRRVSIELEILGRHQHPDLTMPFLKAVAEIVKASKREACLLPPQAESFSTDVRSTISNAKETTQGLAFLVRTAVSDFAVFFTLSTGLQLFSLQEFRESE
ncbi:unnamed protein product [Trifolium pratense]|uniref:Uncharacterized protein n=1 Tax=Trifolium pratense TaxID=57577 RepID=A0ACB0LXS4_TRIPR|nr:unnamed protein product [Trifolium pratense]